MDRCEQISWTDAETNTLRGLDYGFDALGMITNIVTSDDSSQLSVKSYQYDSLNRLIREDSGVSRAEYSYDLAGNRTRTVRRPPVGRP